jgi:glycosyltransferase involved in cell wall biosynthesis
LVVPPSDAQSFGHALDTFWQLPEQVQVWGQQALLRYQETLKAETMAQKYMVAYGELLAPKT